MTISLTMETIKSADRMPIAYGRSGSGPPLVSGMAGDHTRWDLSGIHDAFAEHCMVDAVDRRGRGRSGDAAEYELTREFEDVAAVVEVIDEPVALLGPSLSVLCALGAAS